MDEIPWDSPAVLMRWTGPDGDHGISTAPRGRGGIACLIDYVVRQPVRHQHRYYIVADGRPGRFDIADIVHMRCRADFPNVDTAPILASNDVNAGPMAVAI